MQRFVWLGTYVRAAIINPLDAQMKAAGCSACAGAELLKFGRLCPSGYDGFLVLHCVAVQYHPACFLLLQCTQQI
jgi:hypothetical protein